MNRITGKPASHLIRKRTAAKKTAPWRERRASDASSLAASDRRQLFPIIARVTRTVLGYCFDPVAVTSAQRAKLVSQVTQEAHDAGMKRLTERTVAGRVDFWLKVNDPAKSLWFGVLDLCKAHALLTVLVPQPLLARLADEHADRIGHRPLDHFVLSLSLCLISKNAITENRQSRKEECGTKALQNFLAQSGICTNGSHASLIFQILAVAGLIACIDPSFQIGKRCRRWMPCGRTWELPFLATLADSDLSDLQTAARDAYRREQPQQDRSYSIRSQHHNPTPLPPTYTQAQAGAKPAAGQPASVPAAAEPQCPDWYRVDDPYSEEEVIVNQWFEPYIAPEDMDDEDDVGPGPRDRWQAPVFSDDDDTPEDDDDTDWEPDIRPNWAEIELSDDEGDVVPPPAPHAHPDEDDGYEDWGPDMPKEHIAEADLEQYNPDEYTLWTLAVTDSSKVPIEPLTQNFDSKVLIEPLTLTELPAFMRNASPPHDNPFAGNTINWGFPSFSK